jgi:hypothetical protein
MNPDFTSLFLIVALLKTVGFSNSNEAYKYVKLKTDFMEQSRKKTGV